MFALLCSLHITTDSPVLMSIFKPSNFMVSGFDVHTVALHASLILVLYIQYSLFSVFCHAIYYQSCYRVIQK